MTIVRRNPVTSAQWNVARVSAADNDRVRLEITSSGYQRLTREEGFSREMWMEGSGFWTRIKHRKSRSQDARDGEEAAAAAAKKRKRGYVFDALWNVGRGEERGRCGFKDEAAGKYLKVCFFFFF
jgi:hypothetical protein